MKHLIIGTAGHVDHGKTELVKALTGRDTDRLSEEKSRGISIVLGFAPLDVGEDVKAGIIDVPGHERFVKNMVSGAVGVDIFMLVIAADEGVMPQTLEHFEVLRLLGVRSGVVVISKIDLVEPDLVEVVESEVTDLLEGTPLEGAPFVRASAVTGEGVEALRGVLAEKCEEAAERKDVGFFRLPVDRVFTKAGIGTIVTGTAWSGSVNVGEEVAIEPRGGVSRIREIQSFDSSLESSESSMRLALALHGVKKKDIDIGDQLVSPGKLEKTNMLDVQMEMSSLPGSRIVNRQRLRFHHAAGEIMCRAVLIGPERLERGDRGFAQLRMEKPTVAMGGDRFVIRHYSPMRVIAGGVVLDPLPSKARSNDKGRLGELEALSGGSAPDRIGMIVRRAGCHGFRPEGVVKYGFSERYSRMALDGLEGDGKVIRVGELFFSADIAAEKEEEMRKLLESFIEENSLIWGMEREELRARLGLEESPLFDFLLEKGKRGGTIFFQKGLVRSGSSERRLSADEARVLESIGRMLSKAGYEFLTLEEIAEPAGGAANASRYIHILQERGDAVRIGRDSYIHSDSLGAVLEFVAGVLEDGGELTIGKFKEEFGFSRKYAVPILEYLDNEGYTRRKGNSRVAGQRLLNGRTNDTKRA